MLRRSIVTRPCATLLTLILTLSLLLLTACGGDDATDDPTASGSDASSTATTPTGDQDDDDNADADEGNGDGPCSLLTEDEVAAVVGEDVLGSQSIAVGDDTTLGSCTYDIAPEGSFKVVAVVDHGSLADPSFLASPTGAEDIEGLGEDAHWDPSLSVLVVRYDDESYFTVQIATGVENDAADLEIVKELAARILERL